MANTTYPPKVDRLPELVLPEIDIPSEEPLIMTKDDFYSLIANDEYLGELGLSLIQLITVEQKIKPEYRQYFEKQDEEIKKYQAYETFLIETDYEEGKITAEDKYIKLDQLEREVSLYWYSFKNLWKSSRAWQDITVFLIVNNKSSEIRHIKLATILSEKETYNVFVSDDVIIKPGKNTCEVNIPAYGYNGSFSYPNIITI